MQSRINYRSSIIYCKHRNIKINNKYINTVFDVNKDLSFKFDVCMSTFVV